MPPRLEVQGADQSQKLPARASCLAAAGHRHPISTPTTLRRGSTTHSVLPFRWEAARWTPGAVPGAHGLVAVKPSPGRHRCRTRHAPDRRAGPPASGPALVQDRPPAQLVPSARCLPARPAATRQPRGAIASSRVTRPSSATPKKGACRVLRLAGVKRCSNTNVRIAGTRPPSRRARTRASCSWSGPGRCFSGHHRSAAAFGRAREARARRLNSRLREEVGTLFIDS